VFIVVAVVVVLSLVVVAGAAVVLIRRPLPTYDGAISLAGLRAEVEVVRDERGIPQIYADDPRDLFRAQGYVHAQDRFFEMDYRRHVASGRLAELIGATDGTLEADAVIRTLGWRRAAEAELAMLSVQSRAYLESYVAGVNDYLAGREASRLAVEYTVLGVTTNLADVEPWTEVDSLVWLKALAWDLSTSFEAELERSALYEVVQDIDQVEQLFPRFPQDVHDPIVGGFADAIASQAGGVLASQAGGRLATTALATGSAGGALGGPGSAPSTDPDPEHAGDVLARDALAAVSAAGAALRAVPELAGDGAGLGSNSFVVAGSLTANGAPLLAADPHLGATVPGPWFQAGLHCRTVQPACPFDVAGFGFAGLPGIMIGHNADLAWALTSLPADVTDIFLERVFDDGTYEQDGLRVALERRTETLKVNGGADVRLDIAETSHGPIVSDVLPQVRAARQAPVPDDAPGVGLRGFAVAISSAAVTPGRTLEGILALNISAGPDDVTAAAASFGAPAFNILYATTDGDIGYEAAGQIPQRSTIAGAQVPSDGSWPRPGWESTYDWAGFVAPRDLPRARNPLRGYLVAANQAVQPVGEGPDLGHAWDPGYRSHRIGELIETLADAGTPMTVETSERIQNDVFNPIAPVLTPYLLGVDVEDAFVQQGVDLLRGWDLEQTADSAAAAYFASVWSNVLQLTFWDDMPEGFEPDGDGRWIAMIEDLVDQPQSPWWDDRSTINVVESRDEVLLQALTNARLQLTVSLGKDPTRWAWSMLHKVELEHPALGGALAPAPVRSLLNPRPIAVDGAAGHVNATAWDARVWSDGHPTFAVSSLPSMRMIVDLGDLDASRWVNLTGSSGHPGSEHYTDQLAAWAAGRSYPWPFSADAVRETAADSRRLRPLD
jgi:penicillin amidase